MMKMPVIRVKINPDESMGPLTYYTQECPVCRKDTTIVVDSKDEDAYKRACDSLILINGKEYHKECLREFKKALEEV